MGTVGYDGYVITTAYLLFDSVRPLGVRITCFPHIQSILDSPSLTEFVSSGEQEKMDVSISALFPGNSIFTPHAHSLSLSLSRFFPTISYNLPRWSPSSTQIPLLCSCLLALTLIHLPPCLPCGPHSCTQLSAVSPHTEWHPSGIALNTQREHNFQLFSSGRKI